MPLSRYLTRHGPRLIATPTPSHSHINTNRKRGFALSARPVFTDVLIVGSGAAGLTAALRAASLGLRSTIIEASDRLGGTSAYSGGNLWIPGNHLLKDKDDRADIVRYMDATIGEPTRASSTERRAAFLDNGPKMVRFLEELGFKWRLVDGYPDYYPERPGGRPGGGRTIEPGMFDLNRLGEWKDHMITPNRSLSPPMHTSDATLLTRLPSSLADLLVYLRVLGNAVLTNGLLRRQDVGLGYGLVAQLLWLVKQREDKITIKRSTPLVELLPNRETGGVMGAVVQRGPNNIGGQRVILASKGVLLAAGGFAQNQSMRAQQPAGVSAKWTNTAAQDMGDAIRAGVKAGAATELMEEAWWFPTILDPTTGKNNVMLMERMRPFSMIVDSSGKRYVNECMPYNQLGTTMYARHAEGNVTAVPSWFIMDSRHRKRYVLGTLLPGQKPSKKALEEKWIYKADTLEGLAGQIGVDAGGLRETVERYNGFCAAGKDEDFGRGESAYGRYFGDPSVKPHINLGSLEKPPFYAVQVWPGDLGTKGGLLTDEGARVLKEDGSVIPGLYATGNTSASVMGKSYVGAGATLGPGCTFGYIAAGEMAKKASQDL